MRKLKCSFCHKDIGQHKVCPHCGTIRSKSSTVGHTKTHAPTKISKERSK